MNDSSTQPEATAPAWKCRTTTGRATLSTLTFIPVSSVPSVITDSTRQ
jgi:hypothetical protein